MATPQSIRNICTPKAKVVVLKRQLLELLRALRRIPPRIPLHRRLRSSSNSADQVLRLLLLRRTDELTLAGQTMKKKCCWGYGPKILTALRAGKPEKRGMILRRKWTTNSVPRKQQTSTRSKRKYLVDRYKQAKDWNSKQSGGNRRKSAHYDEIDEVLGCRDIVTLQNVQEAGSVSQESDRNKTTTDASVECDDDAGITSKKEARSARKKTKKREREEEKDDEDREMFKSALSGLESQRSDMNSFVTNFSRMQEQQLTTMNALVGALSKFLEKQ